MAELRKRKPVVGDCKQTADSSFASSYSKKRSSMSWMFFAILLFYLLSLYVSFIASRTVPAPKTTLESSLSEFVEERARKHLDAITSFGPRPTGSYANEVQAVDYIVGALQTIKDSAREDVIIEIDIQRPSGSFTLGFFDGFTSVYRNVTNILVRITPTDSYPPRNTVLVNGHFDSVPGGPGASDDAVSCAVMLEVVRCLAQTRNFRFTHGVVFNFNGAEENVLQASHGFITQHRWVETIRAFVNLEAAGAGPYQVCNSLSRKACSSIHTCRPIIHIKSLGYIVHVHVCMHCMPVILGTDKNQHCYMYMASSVRGQDESNCAL